jgi:hypothetical protein
LWDHVYTPFGIDALVDLIADGTAVLVRDGLYSCKIHSNIDGAGWMIIGECVVKWCFLKGPFTSGVVTLVRTEVNYWDYWRCI